jgi:hypothetical protein
MSVRIQFRRGTSSEWTAANPVLAEGEFALESDTRKFKIGDGTTDWNSLTYAEALPVLYNQDADLLIGLGSFL